MRKKLHTGFISAFIVLSACVFNACRDEPLVVIPNHEPDYAAITAIRYSRDIQPIFDDNCQTAGCHNSVDAASRLILDSWESIFRGSKSGAVVISGNAYMSHLVQVINSDTTLSPVSFPKMPLSRNSLPKDQIRFLMRWIDEGAKNDAGMPPFTNTPRGKVFAANQSADLIAVIDIATNLVIRYVKVGSQAGELILGSPHHVRVDPQGTYFYATLINAQEIWKFSATTYEFIGKISVIPSPADIILTTTGDTAIVTNFSTSPDIVTLINTQTMEVIKRFTLPSALRPFVSYPHGALLTHDGQRLYTTNQVSGNLTLISLSDNSMSIVALDTSGAYISTTSPYLADESPDGRYIFVGCSGTNDVRVIDRTQDDSRATRVIPVGLRPLHVKVSPDGQYVLAANQGSDDVTVIRISDWSTSTIPDVGRQPHGLAFSPDGKILYVTCENRLEAVPPHHPTIGSKGISFVTAIDFSSRQVLLPRIEVGGFAAGISIDSTITSTFIAQ